MGDTRRGRHSHRALTAVAALVGVAGILLLVGVAVKAREAERTAQPGQKAAQASAEVVSALASSTAGPIQLTPAQVTCLRYFGGEAGFRALDRGHQEAVLGTLVPCIEAEERRAAGLAPALPTPRTTPNPNPTPAVPGTPAGSGTIYASGNAPSEGGTLHYANKWVESGPGWSLIVFAGTRWNYTSSGIDASQGVMRVFADGAVPAPRVSTSGEYDTPGKHGAVRITGAVGETLKLQADDGTFFYFDVVSRQYVSGFPAAGAAPAATPAGP